jgi:hypothetical protein
MASRRQDEATWNQITDLARDAFERQVKLGREYAELARSSLTSEGDRLAAGRAYLSAVRRESEHYWRELSTLGVGYAADVAALGLRVGSAVARDMRSAMGGHTTSTAPPREPSAAAAKQPSTGDGRTAAPAAKSADVALHARAGDTARATITVANKHPRARRIRLAAGPVTDSLGDEVDADVVVEPRQVTVPAGEDTTVTLSLDVTDRTFEVGEAYRCTVEITGGEEATVVVHIARDPD